MVAFHDTGHIAGARHACRCAGHAERIGCHVEGAVRGIGIRAGERQVPGYSDIIRSSHPGSIVNGEVVERSCSGNRLGSRPGKGNGSGSRSKRAAVGPCRMHIQGVGTRKTKAGATLYGNTFAGPACGTNNRLPGR